MRYFASTPRGAGFLAARAVACTVLLAACGKQADPPVATRARSLPSPAVTAADLRVEIDQGMVTVHAHEASLRDVLVRIASGSGVELIAQGSLDESVSVDLVSLPLAVVLRKLLGDRSFVLQGRVTTSGAVDSHAGTLWVFAPVAGRASSRELTTADADESQLPSGPEAVAALSAALGDSDENVRVDAVADLGLLNDQRAEAVLTTMASQDADPSVRAEALYALGARRADARNPAFKRALTDTDREVRQAAISALEDLQTEDSVQLLTIALDDDNASIRIAAAEALGETGGSAARRALKRALKDANGAVRETAAEQLATSSAQR